MGQKTHPYGFRLGYNKTWRSRWYAEKDYAKLLHEDLRLRKALKQRLSHAGVSEIDIERTANKIRVNIFSARPGIIIPGQISLKPAPKPANFVLFAPTCAGKRISKKVNADEDDLVLFNNCWFHADSPLT